MLTYTGRRNLYGSLTNDTSTANLALGDTLMANAERQIASLRPWAFLETTFTLSTVADQQAYDIPTNVEKIKAVSVLIGTTRYVPRQAPSKQEWDRVNNSTATKSDFPEWYYVLNGQILFWPIPSSSTSDAVTVQASIKPIDLSKADYTTGTITTATAGSKAIVGSGTSWTAGMRDSYIRITGTNAAGTGDNVWYKIASVTDTTNLVLEKAYQGASIAAGSAAYTLGEASVLPEGFDPLPVYKAVQQYFTTIQPMMSQAQMYDRLYAETLDQLFTSWGNKTDDVLIEQAIDYPFINPNNAPSF